MEMLYLMQLLCRTALNIFLWVTLMSRRTDTLLSFSYRLQDWILVLLPTCMVFGELPFVHYYYIIIIISSSNISSLGNIRKETHLA